MISQYYPVSSTPLVIIVPKKNSADILYLHDLGSKHAELLLVAELFESVNILNKFLPMQKKEYGADFSLKTMANIDSFKTDVKRVLQQVALEEADAGVVYMTDILPEMKKKVSVIEIPKSFNVVAKNYVTVPYKLPGQKQGDELMSLARSKGEQNDFRQFGYETETQQFDNFISELLLLQLQIHTNKRGEI